MSGCGRELNAHFYSAASLKYDVPDTWHDTAPNHIIYLAKVLTDHPKNCNNFFVVQYFGMNFGALNDKDSLASMVCISWNLALCMQFSHAYIYAHKTFKMHVQLEKLFESDF